MIYFAQLRTGGPIKIGYASDAARRFRALQIANWKTLRCLALIEGTEADEARLHQRFRRIHVRGEWFKPTKELRSYIEGLESVPEIRRIMPTGRRLRSRFGSGERKLVTIRLPRKLVMQIDSMREERRTRGNMVRLLLEDALKARRS